VNGRAATAEDMASFIKRNKASKTQDGTVDNNFYRATSYANVESVTVTDPKTVTVKFSKPDPFLLNTLAGAYAKVQAPEAIKAFEKDYSQLKSEFVIGTGGFELKEFAAEGKSRWTRHEKFHTQVNFDAIEWFPLFTDQTAQQVAFENKQLDLFVPTQVKVLDDLKKRFEGKTSLTKAFAANPQAGTYAAGGPPWNDPRRIGAIFKAFDRRALVNTVFQGQAGLTGNTIQPQTAFAMTEKELITMEGYREDRATEEKEARAMWEASGGPALGAITVDIPDIWEGLYSGGAAVITTQLKRVLGNDFNAKIENYTTISTKVTKAQYGNGANNIWFGWISDVQDVDPSLTNFLIYNSTQPQWAQFQVKSDKIDSLTAAGVAEFDVEKRKAIAKDTDKELVKNWGAGIPYSANTISNVLAWNYLKFPEIAAFVTHHEYATGWYFDQKDPTWQGRPA
jgi:ABC-type oligopeptide transport system substrate-binding subunit